MIICTLQLQEYRVEREPIFHQNLHSHWVAKANEISTNNMECTWLMRNKASDTQCKLYSTGLRWVHQALRWVRQASVWVRSAFWIPTSWYQQHEMPPTLSPDMSCFALLCSGFRVPFFVNISATESLGINIQPSVKHYLVINI